MPNENYLNLLPEEREQPLYRIMPVARLLKCLSARQLTLVPPKKWDDPFENLLLSSRLRVPSTEELGNMTGLANSVYGQCWTRHRETDAMWRIYSANSDGVKVKTTPRRLLEALASTAGEMQQVTCFIGRVRYCSQRDLTQHLQGINLFNPNGAGIAESLLYKRTEFRHEREVRLIHTCGSGDVYNFEIDPNRMFDEIVFDPRLDDELCNAYVEAIRSKGFRGRIAKSVLYRVPRALLLDMT